MNVASGAPDLTPIADLAAARATLAAYDAPDAGQHQMRARILAFVDEHPVDAHLRTCLEGHLTASTLLVDARREQLLLHHHRKLDRWLQFGGHCDGDANLRGCAWRETVEESGIEPEWISEQPIDLDVHSIPARPGEPEHQHLDVRYLTVAPKAAEAALSYESNALQWFTPDRARTLEIDLSLRRLIDIAFP